MEQNKSPIFFSSLVIVLILFNLSVEATTNEQDVTALVSLHRAWSQNPSSWDTSTDPCEEPWLGILCDSVTNTRVTQLFLINQGLNGVLPSAIGDLTYLTQLDLSSNPKLGGTLPREITSLKSIMTFNVQFCNFSGTIPSDIGNLTSLTFLGLAQNAFSGALPDTIGLLKYLVVIDISSNKLIGSLPVSTTSTSGSGLDNLTRAHHFHFQNNSFSGSIPSPIFNSNMSLVHVLLNNNNFTGSIPSSIGDLLHVEIIRLDFNLLNGSVPSNLTITNLTTLHLNDNELSGQLPDLSNNKNLQILYLGNNRFDAGVIPSWINNITNLYLLFSTFPSMDSANLIGSIPANIFDSKLSSVTLSSNNLNGTLNLTLANSTLLLVNVTNNNMVSLDKGNYTGAILLDGNPFCNNNSTECSILQFAGTPPPPSPTSASKCIKSCPLEYVINPKAPTNCQCTLPVVATSDITAAILPLLTYKIPIIEIRFASDLRASSFLKNFTFLDTQVVVQMISSTQATVSVFPPTGTNAWSSQDAAHISVWIKDQMGIYGAGCWIWEFPKMPYDTVFMVYKLNTSRKIGIGVGVVVSVIAIMVIGVFAMKQIKRAKAAEKLNKPFASWIAPRKGETIGIPQLKGARWFSLEEMRKCTDNFSQSNEIGKGGYGKVYKGFLSPGGIVAIKRAGPDSLQGATEFKNEIEFLSRVHHINLVGLIGFCFEKSEQMLVYEYMPNGTLRELLSGKADIHMDWERRIALALGSARGIAYLHTQANPPIIHRDIKSSNILLDDKLVAKVSDFGLSTLAPTDDADVALSMRVKGTPGYLDPDYFLTSTLTNKSDVYSFGVVLLEVVTARLPIQGGKYVVHEIRIALEKGGIHLVVESMVDPNLREYPPKALETLLVLALSCVQDSPAARPTMVEVVKAIESLSEVSAANMDVNLEEK